MMRIRSGLAVSSAVALVAMLVTFTFGLAGPFRAETSHRRALELARQGRFDESLIRFERALEFGGERAAWLLDRARVHRSRGDLDAALSDLAFARKLDPDDVSGLLLAAEIRLDRREEALAEELVAEALARGAEGDPRPLLARAKLRRARGELRAALADLARVVQALDAPERVEAHFLRGSIHDELGEPALAFAEYASAMELEPRNAVYRDAVVRAGRRGGPRIDDVGSGATAPDGD